MCSTPSNYFKVKVFSFQFLVAKEHKVTPLKILTGVVSVAYPAVSLHSVRRLGRGGRWLVRANA
jgi:hypothetical protein